MEQLWIVVLLIASVQAWTYEGQNEWSEEYPACGSKRRQSPIKFNTMEVYTKGYPPLNYNNYKTPSTVTITNNGHTAEIQYPNDAAKPQLSGGPLPNGTLYEFANVHFHWGANDSLGSEHVINRQRYAAEVHAVHYNTRYGSLEEALNYGDGVAVLTTFYQANPAQNLTGLQDVSEALTLIQAYESSTEIENFKLSGLFGGIDSSSRNFYYTYLGSLTTPPCAEAVIWIISTRSLDVNPQQLVPFRLLLDENGEALVNNFRELQRKNGRRIYLNRPRLGKDGDE
ncbi:carbonic anhydrase 2-like [Musca vetustissima]|uniref:carbonic anhydrase 2-like n=1 Tax=Musca vetustissima TaxID=27455 RepID=UPI002AB6D107|nr:carbonic anhydrase 2-like [Musca vetustissima]